MIEIINDIIEKIEEFIEKYIDNGIDDLISYDDGDDVGFGGVGKEFNFYDFDVLVMKGNEDDFVGEKEVIIVFIVEVIVVVVVGVVCVVIFIVFFVYWFCKWDEGSYVLYDVGYKDIYKL